MTEIFYLPSDSIMAPHAQDSIAMKPADTYNSETTTDKLDNFNVNVTEIEPEVPTEDFDKLSILSPIPSPRPVTVIKRPHPHHEPLHLQTLGKRHDSPRASSPTGSVRSSFTSHRHVSRGMRRSIGFKRSYSYRSATSRELTTQAESEFHALIELISSVSRKSSSLKEVWTKIMSERESSISEMDQMYEQLEEYSDASERREREQEEHTHELQDRKKEIGKLRLEITVATTAASEYKKKLIERDTELGDAHRQIAAYKDNFKHLKEEYEETKTTFEETCLKLAACEEARRNAEEDARKHHGELRSLKQQFVELKTSHSELTSKYESTQTELVSLKQSNTTLKKEKHEWMHEKGEMEERLKKCNHWNDELKRKLKELTESYEKKVRELHDSQEIISKTKRENEELHQKVKDLRRELEEEHSKWEDAEDRCGKWKLKWENSDQDIVSVREELRLIETEQAKLHEIITKKTEELRRVVVEKERFQEDYHGACKKAEESHRQVLTLQESLRRTESKLKEKIELEHTLNERIEHIECERDEARSKCHDLSVEISEFQKNIVSLRLEIQTVREENKNVSEKYHKSEAMYLELCEYEEGNNEAEYEITQLRNTIREVREQKEKAIDMRKSADRERDEALVKYDEKCREVERLELASSQQFHLHGRAGGRTTSQSFFRGSRSTSAVHGHEHGHEQEYE